MSRIAVRIAAVREEARDIRAYDLEATNGAELPAFEAGAHVTLFLPNGLARSYSLVGSPDNRRAYTIAVKREREGRGGSAFVHDQIAAGSLLEIGEPLNNFRLDEHAPHTVLVAGGIGITPIYTMAKRLAALGRSWELLYAARSPEDAAFHQALSSLGRTRFFFFESAGQKLDLAEVFRDRSPGTHFYCCGPTAMLDEFVASATTAPAFVHIERFTGRADEGPGAGFHVKLARDGRTFFIPPDRSILEVLDENGLDVSSSCREGLCGACETRVLEGIPDHKDFVLDDDQHASNQVMMICCSRALTETLTLDI
jgi:vanillate O-demethylase ferredoxin subunit